MGIDAIIRRWIEVVAALFLAWRERRRERCSLIIGNENGQLVVRQGEPNRDAIIRDAQSQQEPLLTVLPPETALRATLGLRVFWRRGTPTHPLPFSSIAFLVLWSASIFVAGANAQSQDQPAGILANPLQAQLLDRLSATRDRPLFSPSRRPPAPPPPPVERVPEAAAPPPPPNVTLFGIVIDGDRARAIVRSGTAKIARVQIGDDIGGWKVSQIEERRLVLLLDGRLATFALFSPEGGRRPPDDPTSKAADQLQDQPQQHGVQQMTPQAAEPQSGTSRRRRRARE
jgi:hypothetical protein